MRGRRLSRSKLVLSFAGRCSHVGPSPVMDSRASAHDSRNASPPLKLKALMNPGGAGSLRLTPEDGRTGSASITLTVSDPIYDGSVSTAFTVTVI